MRNVVEVNTKPVLGSPKSWEKRTVPYPAFLDPFLDRATRTARVRFTASTDLGEIAVNVSVGG